jgi:hypothetical protein
MTLVAPSRPQAPGACWAQRVEGAEADPIWKPNGGCNSVTTSIRRAKWATTYQNVPLLSASQAKTTYRLNRDFSVILDSVSFAIRSYASAVPIIVAARDRGEPPMRTDTILTRRTAMASLSAAAMLPPEAGSALDGPETTAEDRIFPVLAASKQAITERMAYLESDHVEETRAAELADREFEMFHKLFTTAPTTVAGIAALIDQLALGPYDPYNDKATPQSVVEMAFDMDRERTGAALTALAATLRRRADIIVCDVEGTRLCSIQVKTRRERGRDGGWHMKDRHEKLRSDTLFYCFVDFGTGVNAPVV